MTVVNVEPIFDYSFNEHLFPVIVLYVRGNVEPNTAFILEASNMACERRVIYPTTLTFTATG